MTTDIRWINAPIRGRLAIMPKPRPGEWLEDEIAGWHNDGIHFVVSTLEPEETAKFGLEKEASFCERYMIGFLSLPFPDRGVPPSVEETAALVQTLKVHVQNSKTVAIHCRSGIGRSSVVAACVLHSVGVEPQRAFELIASARGFMVPDTKEQRAWVEQFAASTAIA